MKTKFIILSDMGGQELNKAAVPIQEGSSLISKG